MPIPKKSGNLSYAPRIYIYNILYYIYIYYIYIYIYIYNVSKQMQPINMIIYIASSHLSSESKKTIISLPKGQTRWQGQKLLDFILQCTWKTKFLGTFSGEFFGLLPTESFTVSTLSGHIAVNFLQDLGSSAFLFRLFTEPVTLNLCTKRWILLLWG